MEQLKKIISHLGASCLVFVENDFVPVSDNKKIISKYLILPIKCKLSLQDKLRKLGKGEFVDQLLLFEEKFNTIEHTETKDAYLQTGEIDSYLKTLGNIGNISDCINEICTKISKDIAPIFFQYGIIESHPDQYNDLFNEFLNPNSELILLLYTNITPSDIIDFKDTLISIMSTNESFSFIAIIDNKLGSGEDSGVKIANEYIKNIVDDTPKMSVYSIVFTSQKPPVDNNDFDNGYYQVVAKSDNAAKDISKALSLIAFTKTFSYIHGKTTEAVLHVPKIIKENKHSIAYIVNKANDEGILPYEAINLWYENAVNYLVNKFIIEEKSDHFLTSTIGLVKLFAEHYNSCLQNDCASLKDIDTNEIFDYTINKKHLPIAPGDVFLSNEVYYILIGQTCDVSLRSDMTRNSNIALLVNASFETLTNKQKCKSKVIREKEYVKLNCFKNQDNCVGFLKIELKTKSTIHVDFDIIDLAVYNENGECKINTNNSLSDNIKKYLASSIEGNYDKIKEKLLKILSIPEDIRGVLKDKDNGILEYKKEGDDISYPYKRICRIKGNFNRLIHDNYWNYRSRIDLNEINLTNNER